MKGSSFFKYWCYLGHFELCCECFFGLHFVGHFGNMPRDNWGSCFWWDCVNTSCFFGVNPFYTFYNLRLCHKIGHIRIFLDFYDALVFLINWCVTINTNILCYIDIEGVHSLKDLCLVCDEWFTLLQNNVTVILYSWFLWQEWFDGWPKVLWLWPSTTPFLKINRNRFPFGFSFNVSPLSEVFPVFAGFIIVVMVSKLSCFNLYIIFL